MLVTRKDTSPSSRRRSTTFGYISIPVLVDHFVRKHAQRTGKPIETIDPAARLRLQTYDWPGNVRELENTIERAIVLATDTTLTARDVSLPDADPRSSSWHGLPSANLRRNVAWAEQETIRHALEVSGGVRKAAAALIGISQRALSHYLAKHEIE